MNCIPLHQHFYPNRLRKSSEGIRYASLINDNRNATPSFINHDMSIRFIHPTNITRAGIAQSIQWPDNGLNSRWIMVEFQAWAKRPDYLWSTQHSLFFKRDASIFHWGWRSRRVKLTNHSHLVPRLRMNGATPPIPHKPQFMHTDNFTFILQATNKLT